MPTVLSSPGAVQERVNEVSVAEDRDKETISDGGVVSGGVKVAIKESREEFPAASEARTTRSFDPWFRGMEGVVQEQEVCPVHPDDDPDPPVVRFCHVTDVTPTLSEAVPPRVMEPGVDEVMEMEGAVVSEGIPPGIPMRVVEKVVWSNQRCWV